MPEILFENKVVLRFDFVEDDYEVVREELLPDELRGRVQTLRNMTSPLSRDKWMKNERVYQKNKTAIKEWMSNGVPSDYSVREEVQDGRCD